MFPQCLYLQEIYFLVVLSVVCIRILWVILSYNESKTRVEQNQSAYYSISHRLDSKWV